MFEKEVEVGRNAKAVHPVIFFTDAVDADLLAFGDQVVITRAGIKFVVNADVVRDHFVGGADQIASTAEIEYPYCSVVADNLLFSGLNNVPPPCILHKTILGHLPSLS